MFFNSIVERIKKWSSQQTEKQVISVKLPMEVRTYDIDAAGHVNNIVYIRWMEDLRVNLIDQFIPFKKLMANNLFPVVASTYIKYKKPIKLFDNVTGVMWIENIERSIWTIKSEFKIEDKIAATATQQVVLVNTKTDEMVRFTKGMIG